METTNADHKPKLSVTTEFLEDLFNRGNFEAQDNLLQNYNKCNNIPNKNSYYDSSNFCLSTGNKYNMEDNNNENIFKGNSIFLNQNKTDTHNNLKLNSYKVYENEFSQNPVVLSSEDTSYPDINNEHNIKNSHHHNTNIPAISRRRISSSKLPAFSRKLAKSDISKTSNNMLDHQINSSFPHKLFVQMDEYSLEDGLIGGHHCWKEIARWIKYQEDFEESANRWGRPHVPILSFHGLAELRKRLETGTMLLDLTAKDYYDVIEKICKELRDEGHLVSKDTFNAMLNCLAKPHKHHQKRNSIIPSNALPLKVFSKISLTKNKYFTEVAKLPQAESVKVPVTGQSNGDAPTNLNSTSSSPLPHKMNRTPKNIVNNPSKDGISACDNLLITDFNRHDRNESFAPRSIFRKVRGKAVTMTNTIPEIINRGNETVGDLQIKKKDAKKVRIESPVRNGRTSLSSPSRNPKNSIFGQINNAFSRSGDEDNSLYVDRQGVLVLIGSAVFLNTEITVFTRLKTPISFPNGVMENSSIPVRFVIIVMGPSAGGPPSQPESVDVDKLANKPKAVENGELLQEDQSFQEIDLNTDPAIHHNNDLLNQLDPALQRGDHRHIRHALSAPVSYELAKGSANKKFIETDYRELGQTFSSLMSNEDFNLIAYRAETCQDLTSAFNAFLKNAIVLPPGEFGRSTLMPITNLYKEQLMKKKLQKDQIEWGRNKGLDKKLPKFGNLDVSIKKPGGKSSKGEPGDNWNWRKPFGGLIEDVKRKIPFYLNDYTNAFKLQCLSTFVFIYFACLSPCVTFGAILSTKTNNWLGISETMIATSLGGCIFALFSGQPLTIIGPTGPILIFEDSLYKFSVQNRINYLAFRFWVALWVAIITLIFLAFQGGYLIRYLTRFIQEIFSILISFIFIYETFSNLYNIFHLHPLLPDYCHLNLTLDPWGPSGVAAGEFISNFFPVSTISMYNSAGIPSLNSLQFSSVAPTKTTLTTKIQLDYTESLDKFKIYPEYNGTKVNNYIYKIPYYELKFPSDYSITNEGPDLHRKFESYIQLFHIIRPNTALFAALLMFGTFFIAYFLKVFRNSKYFGRGARRALADFGVPIAIIAMIMFYYLVGKNVYIPKLNVPSKFMPTSPANRGWIVNPFTGSKPIYDKPLANDTKGLPTVPSFYYEPIRIPQIFLAIYPALMIFILLFLEGMITSRIVNRKDRKFIKGPGYNLDMLILGVSPLILSIFGLPFLSGATVRSLAHVSSLTVFSRSNAPGDSPAIIGVLEQRVTAFAVALCIGLSMFFSRILQKIPVAVLFGIFLYMGISSLKGIQFFDRILIMLMPLKHYPTLNYVRNIRLLKLHLYTLIQLSCLIILWVVRSTPAAQAFPFVLIIYILVRFQLHWIYTPRELYELDKNDEGSDSDDDIDVTEEVHMPI